MRQGLVRHPTVAMPLEQTRKRYRGLRVYRWTGRKATYVPEMICEARECGGGNVNDLIVHCLILSIVLVFLFVVRVAPLMLSIYQIFVSCQIVF